MFGFNPNKIQRSPNNENSEKEKVEGKETKKEKIVLEIDGQKLEGEKYYFEYPKNIQEETGILGYDRTKISKENLTSLGDLDKDSGKKIVSLLTAISNNEYPNNCLTHRMSAFTNKDNGIKNAKSFMEDKFFLQKIYSMDRIEKEKLSGINPKDIFSNRGDYLDFYSKKDNSPDIELNKKKLDIGRVTNELLQERDVFLIKNFNVAPGSFWQYDIGSEDIAFGFSVFKNELFKEYLKLSIINWLSTDHYLINADRIENDYYLDKVDYIITYKDMFALYLVNEYKNHGYNFGDISKDEEYNNELKKGCISKLNDIAKDFLRENSPNKEEHFINNLKIGEYTMHRLFGRYYNFRNGRLGNTVSEIDMCIFINNNKIPQLSWGHAKYAHYFNEKGFNFFEFKHADHLPKPKDLKESKKEGE